MSLPGIKGLNGQLRAQPNGSVLPLFGFKVLPKNDCDSSQVYNNNCECPFLYSQSLRFLKLSDCNLYHLPQETFQKLPNLQELYTSHNQIENMNSIQSVGRLTLHVRNNYLTDIQSDILTILTELICLNLNYNKLSTLNMTLMKQLVNMSSSIDLNVNAWECDCFMFNTIYSWCRDNSVDMELVCSSPPEFKGQTWTIYDENGCFDDDYITDIAKEGQGILMNNDKFHPNIIYEGYECNKNFEKCDNSLSSGIH